MMGYVEAARAVWKLYSLRRWKELEDIGLSEQKHKPLLNAFSDSREASENSLSGVEALTLLIEVRGVLEGCSRLLKRYDKISTTIELKERKF